MFTACLISGVFAAKIPNMCNYAAHRELPDSNSLHHQGSSISLHLHDYIQCERMGCNQVAKKEKKYHSFAASLSEKNSKLSTQNDISIRTYNMTLPMHKQRTDMQNCVAG